jgi:hypothetical protein
LLEIGDRILPFGRDDRSSTLRTEALLFAVRSVGSTAVLSASMFDSSVEDRAAAAVAFHD